MTRDLIVFGEDWGRHPSSTQHLTKHLVKDRKVVWVNSIGLRRPRFSLDDINRVGRKLGQAFRRRSGPTPAPIPEGMTVINPVALPLPGNPMAAYVNRRTLGRKIRQVCRERGLRNPVLWASLPTAVDVVGACGEEAVIYYCGDDFGALTGVDHRPVLGCEQRLAEQADIIFAASDVLAAKFDQMKTHYLPHGADVDLFSRSVPRAAELPAQGPVAGFYGSLSEWLDQDLMVECARLLPEWSFVFIGEERTDVSRLRHSKNIHLLGSRAHHELPAFAQHWDVSLMPFVDNAQIRACNPLKLREYMAAGRPIVATPFPALAAYGTNIWQAANPIEYAHAIAASLDDTPEAAAQRRKAVSSESWRDRANDVSRHIEGL